MTVRLISRPLSVAAAYRAVAGPGLGGVVLFIGRVRPDRIPAGTVVGLDYEADRAIALAALQQLEKKALRRWPGGRVLLWHRTGSVSVDTPSVIVAAGAAHRSQAFAMARWLIERLKVEVPLWKTARVRPVRRRRQGVRCVI